MGNTSSGEEGSGLASPNILSKVTVQGSKADMDAFLTEGRVNNVHIGYVTKKQVRPRQRVLASLYWAVHLWELCVCMRAFCLSPRAPRPWPLCKN